MYKNGGSNGFLNNVTAIMYEYVFFKCAGLYYLGWVSHFTRPGEVTYMYNQVEDITNIITAGMQNETVVFVEDMKTADVAPVNIFQDFAAALQAVAQQGNVPGNDDDVIFILTPPIAAHAPTTPDAPTLPPMYGSFAGPQTIVRPVTGTGAIIDNPPVPTAIPGQGNDLGAISGQLGGILGLLQGIWDSIKSLPQSIATAVVGTATIDYSPLKNNIDLTTVFPFCIPFDFIRAITSLQAAPQAPSFTIDFSGTVLGDYIWELDMADFETPARVIRWGVWISFFIGLMIATQKFIKW
jgi:hypothetical protein